MSYPFIPQFKYRYYVDATSSSSGAPVGTVVVANRSKFIGGWFVPNNAGTGTNVTGFDVVGFQAGSSTAITISSGTSVTTTTGTLASAINVNGVGIPIWNAGDIISIIGSTCQGGFYTLIMQDF